MHVPWFILASVLALAAAAGWFFHALHTRSTAARLQAQLRLVTEEEADASLRNEGSAAFTGMIEEMNRILERFRSLTEERVRFEKARREWFAHISHDIRTPLTSIIGYIDAIRDDVPSSPEQQKQFMEVVKNKAEELKSMVESMFQFARLKAEDQERGTSEIDIPEIVRRCLTEMAPLLERQNFVVEADIPEGRAPGAGMSDMAGMANIEGFSLRGDPVQIERLFRNILYNALKHAESGKYLAVSVRGGAGRLEISVRDKGPGVPKEVIDAVMQERRIRGGGFGLHIARHIAERHGGRLSISPGLPPAGEGGTTVTVTFENVRKT